MLGFVKKDDVKLEDLAGESSRIVVPDGQVSIEKKFVQKNFLNTEIFVT